MTLRIRTNLRSAMFPGLQFLKMPFRVEVGVETTFNAFIYGMLKRQDSLLIGFQYAKTCTDHLAHIPVPATGDLSLYELLEMFTQRNGSVARHGS